MSTEVEDEVIETSADATAELQRLRSWRKSMLAKNAERKARIVELETHNATLKAKADEAEAKAHDALVGVPLRALADQVSDAPKLWLEQFGKSYTVESVEGNLTVLNLDGSPALIEGEAVPFTSNGLWRLLTGGATNYGKTEATATFATLMRWQGATGSGASASVRNGSMNPPVSAAKADKKTDAPSFGLR